MTDVTVQVPVASASTPDIPARPDVEAASVRVADHLRGLILSGEIGPGQRIRQEDVAARFGASRLPVREALLILEAEGLVEHERNKGARVPRLSMHEVDVMYRMRERLEPLALLESMPGLDDRARGRLEEIQTRIEARVDVPEFLRLDREFHLLTYSACAIPTLTATVHRLWNATQHHRRAFVTISGPGRAWVVNAEHRLLLDAIERGDGVDAEQHLAGHIRRTRVELSHHPEVFG